jgi:hypothetical protein
MDREQQIIEKNKQYLNFNTLELEYTLMHLIKKRNSLYLKGLNDENINDKIRLIQTKIRNYANPNT